MGTTVNRKRSLSSSATKDWKYSKTELWQVVSDSITEPENARNATGLPAIGALISGTTMRCSKKRSELNSIGSGGFYVWDVTVDYDTPDNTVTTEPVDGTEIWVLSGSMNNETVKTALSQEPMTGSVPVGLLVGIKDDGTVEGMPWGVPTITLSVTLYKNRSAIDAAYIAGCVRQVGRVNSATWYGFAAGEVRLESISIPKKLESLWALQFDFGIRPNEDNAALPTYTGPNSTTFTYSRDVLGWEYPWVKEIEAIDGDNKVILVEGLYIAKRFKSSDFSALDLSGSLF
jgi:hypothetical protein